MKQRKQLFTAFAMVLMGIGTGIGSQSYLSVYDLAQNSPLAPAAAEALAGPGVQSVLETPDLVESEEETEAEIIYTPSVSSLNLAFYYPEDADKTDSQTSRAGEILETLAYKDSEWLSSIYQLSSTNPVNMASRLGKDTSSVKGLYNSKDTKQDSKKPETWLIHDWSKIDMTFYDESGRVISANSNIKEIMSMANTYFYYKNPEDYQAFLNYALSLWDKSHSFSYSMSDVYYCSGCMEADKAEEESSVSETEISETSGARTEGPGNTSAVQTAEVPETTAGPALMVATSSQAFIVPETTAPNGPGVATAAASEEGQTVAAGFETTAGSVAENTKSTDNTETGINTESSSGQSAKEDSQETTGVSESQSESAPALVKCPGHVDLRVRAVISGLSSSKKGLYSLDTEGSKTDGNWTGWTKENQAAAGAMTEQDWEEAYGLTIFSSYIANPLSSAEIAYYMGLLPSDTSQARRKVIQYALSSVGKIPYYWGGKPVSTDYVENHFGSLITPDDKGRSMKGLDCSGWINWVYWSAIGLRLPSASTEGLAFCGTSVLRENLKPGDIIVRRGKDAHVVMFLCWESGGRMKVIHESASGHNNVSVGSMEARWPYYRKLID